MTTLPRFVEDDAWPFPPNGGKIAGSPHVLLPVRLETRFVDMQDATLARLCVRIYPDDIHAEAHDERLGAQELEDGRAYHADLMRILAEMESVGGNESPTQRSDRAETAAWTALLDKGYDAPRAAWIVRSTRGGAGSAGRNRPFGSGAVARTLPDRFVVVGYRPGGPDEPTLVEVFRVVGRKVPSELRLTRDLGSENPLDWQEPLWLTDFDEAVRVGMAVQITRACSRDRFWKVADGLKLLIAVGLRTSAGNDDGAVRLASLLTSHRYGQGLELVAPGKSTNNTADQPSSHSGSKARRSTGYRWERRETVPRETAYNLFAKLGLSEAQRQGLRELSTTYATDHAREVRRALWPVLRETLTTRLALGLKAGQFEALASHFDRYVRPEGPYPVLRVGEAPYGVLPIRLREDIDDPWLARLRPHWEQAADRVPRVGRGDDPEEEFAAILAMDGVSHGVRAIRFRGRDRAEVDNAFARRPGDLDHEKRSSSVLGPSFPVKCIVDAGPSAHWARSLASDARGDDRVGLPFVGPEDEELQANYPADYDRTATGEFRLKEARRESLDRFWGNKVRIWMSSAQFLDSGSRTQSLLLQLLAATDPSQEALVDSVRSALSDVYDPETRHDADHPTRPAYPNWTAADDYLRHPAMWQYRQLDAVEGAGRWKQDEVVSNLPRLMDVVGNLQTTDSQVLADQGNELYVRQTLDALSHRLDAWITSFATRALEEARASNDALGSVLGAWSYVEDLWPNDTDPHSRDGAETKGRVRDSVGYIHAPSLDQAVAAAVLRNAHEFGSADVRQEFAVELSSARVRRVRWLLQGVRQGQDIRSLLGQQFERTLHDRDQQAWIEDFRRTFPMDVAEVRTTPEGADPVHHAQDVVDGLRLLEAWRTRRRFDEVRDSVNASLRSGPRLSSGSTADGVLSAAVQELDDLLDAALDVLNAESVYRMVQGNPGLAGSALAVMESGAIPSQPGVIETPRESRGIRQKIVLLFDEGDAPGSGWDRTARSRAAPRLERWLQALMPGPADRARFDLVARPLLASSGGEPPAPRSYTLTGFDIAAVDLVRLQATGQLAQTLVEAAVPASDRESWRWSLDAEPTGEALVLADLLAVADLAGELLGHARPLLARDLGDPDATSLESADTASADPLLPTLPEFINPLALSAPPRSDAERFVVQAARTRPAVAAWQRLRLLSTPPDRPPIELEAAVLPGGIWSPDALSAEQPLTQLLVERPFPASGGTVSGLVIDAWEDRAAAPTVTTGIAVHYDDPGAEAPQVILVAPPRPEGKFWSSVDDLLALVIEARALAQLRGVMQEDLPHLAQVLPLTHVVVRDDADPIRRFLEDEE